MKKIIFIVFFITITFSLRSQNWGALGEGLGSPPQRMYFDTTDNYLYATMQIPTFTSDGRALRGIARWDGVKWDSVGHGFDHAANALSFARFHSDLYVGGAFDSVGYLACKGIGVWKGSYWDTMVVQPFSKNFGYPGGVAVLSVDTIHDELYIGGTFDSIIGVQCKGFAKWNGSVITPIGMPSNIFEDAYIFAIQDYDGYKYLGGNFSSDLSSDTIQDIIRYDGVNFSTVGGGLRGAFSEVSSMVVYHDELYVAGYFPKEVNYGNNIQK